MKRDRLPVNKLHHYLFGLWLFASPAYSQTTAPIVWKAAADAPTSRYEGEGAAASGKLYTFGGFFDNTNRAIKRCDAYDPSTNTWTQLADMPEAITHSGTAVDGNFLYLAGGFVGNHPGPITDHVWKYDISTDTWTAFVPLPAARGGGMVVRLGRELHFFGGVIRVGSTYRQDTPEHWAISLDAANPTWITKAPLPNPRNHLGGLALNGKIYAVGGQHLGREDSENQTSLHEYDPRSDTWTEKAAMPRPLGHVASSVFSFNNRLVVVAGVTNEHTKVANVIEYNPATDTWRELTPLPSGRQSPVADVIDGKIVVNGGSNGPVHANTWIGTPLGTILWEVWTNVPGSTTATIPLNTPPTQLDQITSFRTPASYGDNYGQRIRGYLYPPVSGNYRFFIQGDDQAELYLSSDDNPIHKQKIASVQTSWNWTGQPTQQSASINLTAGKSYYIEALHKEALGGDVLRIGWRTPDMASVSEPIIIPGSVLLPYQNPTLSPKPLTAKASDLSVTVALRWRNVEAETGYVVERATTPSGPYAKIATINAKLTTDSSVAYTDQNLTPATAYYYRVYATSEQGATPYSNVATISTYNPCTSTGIILREVWTNVPGSTIASIPVDTPPTLTSQLTSFRTPASYGDNYGQRIRGYLCAPATGTYQFFIQGDDQAELYLSSDYNPVNKRKIASVSTSWNWNDQPTQRSAQISLLAGKSYYIEVLHKEALGGDVVRVGWRTPDMATASEPVIIPGSALSSFVSPGNATARKEVLQQPEAERQNNKLEITPNPFSERATIAFTTVTDEWTRLEVYDTQGRRVAQLFEGLLQAGELHQFFFDGSRLGQGLYIVRLVTTQQTNHRKVLLTR